MRRSCGLRGRRRCRRSRLDGPRRQRGRRGRGRLRRACALRRRVPSSRRRDEPTADRRRRSPSDGVRPRLPAGVLPPRQQLRVSRHRERVRRRWRPVHRLRAGRLLRQRRVRAPPARLRSDQLRRVLRRREHVRDDRARRRRMRRRGASVRALPAGRASRRVRPAARRWRRVQQLLPLRRLLRGRRSGRSARVPDGHQPDRVREPWRDLPRLHRRHAVHLRRHRRGLRDAGGRRLRARDVPGLLRRGRVRRGGSARGVRERWRRLRRLRRLRDGVRGLDLSVGVARVSATSPRRARRRLHLGLRQKAVRSRSPTPARLSPWSPSRR
jgi:hypothetical protein